VYFFSRQPTHKHIVLALRPCLVHSITSSMRSIMLIVLVSSWHSRTNTETAAPLPVVSPCHLCDPLGKPLAHFSSDNFCSALRRRRLRCPRCTKLQQNVKEARTKMGGKKKYNGYICTGVWRFGGSGFRVSSSQHGLRGAPKTKCSAGDNEAHLSTRTLAHSHTHTHTHAQDGRWWVVGWGVIPTKYIAQYKNCRRWVPNAFAEKAAQHYRALGVGG